MVKELIDEVIESMREDCKNITYLYGERSCAYCKHSNCNQDCSKCTNSEYNEETDKYNCNCLQKTTIKASTCPYFRADTGD